MKDDAAGLLLDTLADAVAERVVTRLMAGTGGEHIDQHGSPLGPRRHCTAVRRRTAAGEAGAAKIGRRYLLTKEALDEELTRAAKRGPRRCKQDEGVEELARELGIVERRKASGE